MPVAVSSPLLWYATRATGVVALVLLTAAVVLGVLTATRAGSARWPRFAVSDLHRRISLLAALFLLLHILTTVTDSFVHIPITAAVVPFASSYRPLWVGLGAIAFDLFLAVMVSSLLRRRISAASWRGIHWLAFACWPIAVVHALETGTDAGDAWLQVVVGACVGSVVAAVGWRLWERNRSTGSPRSGPRRPVLQPIRVTEDRPRSSAGWGDPGARP